MTEKNKLLHGNDKKVVHVTLENGISGTFPKALLYNEFARVSSHPFLILSGKIEDIPFNTGFLLSQE